MASIRRSIHLLLFPYHHNGHFTLLKPINAIIVQLIQKKLIVTVYYIRIIYIFDHTLQLSISDIAARNTQQILVWVRERFRVSGNRYPGEICIPKLVVALVP